MNTARPILKNSKELKSSAAFTLVETMVGLAIFLLVVASIVQLVQEGFKVYERSRDVIRVTQTMQYQMENLRGMEVTEIAQLVSDKPTTIFVDSDGIPLADQTKKGATPFNWKGFAMTQSITREQTDLYKAEIEVSWTDRQGIPRDETYMTWFYDGGLNNYYLRTE